MRATHANNSHDCIALVREGGRLGDGGVGREGGLGMAGWGMEGGLGMAGWGREGGLGMAGWRGWGAVGSELRLKQLAVVSNCS